MRGDLDSTDDTRQLLHSLVSLYREKATMSWPLDDLYAKDDEILRLRKQLVEIKHWWSIMREVIKEPESLRDPWRDAYEHIEKALR